MVSYTDMETTKKTTSNTETVNISRAEYEELKAQNCWLLEQLRVVRSKAVRDFFRESIRGSAGTAQVSL